MDVVVLIRVHSLQIPGVKISPGFYVTFARFAARKRHNSQILVRPLNLFYHVQRGMHDELVIMPRLVSKSGIPIPTALGGSKLNLE